jgi:hypothetical protein
MGTCSFRDFEDACKRLGLKRKELGRRFVWEGFDIKGNFLYVAIHKHTDGRGIPNGTFNAMLKQLKFKNEQDFKDFLSNKKRRR